MAGSWKSLKEKVDDRKFAQLKRLTLLTKSEGNADLIELMEVFPHLEYVCDYTYGLTH